jgi:hypothetical protein
MQLKEINDPISTKANFRVSKARIELNKFRFSRFNELHYRTTNPLSQYQKDFSTNA